MGLMDKVKAAAEKAAEGAKKGAAIAKDKVGDVQMQRKADDAAKQIGYLIVAERTEGKPAGTEVDRLVQEILSLRENMAEGPQSVSEGEGAAPGDGGATAPAAPEVPAGDVKPD